MSEKLIIPRFAGLLFENQSPAKSPAEEKRPPKKRRKLTREERAQLLAQNEADLKLIDASREPGEEPLWPPKPGTYADLAGMLDDDEDDYDGDDVAAQIREDAREIAEEKAKSLVDERVICEDCGEIYPAGTKSCRRTVECGTFLVLLHESCPSCRHKHRGESRESRYNECGCTWKCRGGFGWCQCANEEGHARSPWTNGTLGDGRRRR